MILRVSCAIVAAALLAGCEESTPLPPARPVVQLSVEKPIRIVCITPCVNEPFFQQVRQGACDAAKAMQVQCDFVGTPAVDIPAQVQLVRNAINSGCDGIALNIIDATAFRAVITEAEARGIPVVAFNVNGQANSTLPTIAQDLFQAGSLAAETAKPLITPGSRVLVTGHDGGSMSVDERYRGFFQGMKEMNLQYTWVLTSGNVAQVSKAVAAKLAADPGIQVILASGLSNTEGTGQAIEQHFRNRELTVIGFDSSSEVERLIDDGIVSFTIDQQPYAQGYYPVVSLALAKRNGLAPVSVDTGARVIRRGRIRELEK